ncbi:DsbA family protein [bacterium]|nr:DsbA family protein [bacterium]
MESKKEKKDNSWRTIGLILIGLLVGYISGRFELTTITFNNDNKTVRNPVKTMDDKSAVTTPSKKPIAISEDDDPYLGDENTIVTIIDFSDYQCPFCNKFYSNILPQLKTDYIDTGKVKYVFRDFPLNIHPKAKYAHYSADCALEQGKYWEMHNKLFESQSDWEKSDDLTKTFTDYASELGMNTSNFQECLASEKYKDEVKKDIEDGISYGVKGTPTLFINGKPIRGVSNYEYLKQTIEKAL